MFIIHADGKNGERKKPQRTLAQVKRLPKKKTKKRNENDRIRGKLRQHQARIRRDRKENMMKKEKSSKGKTAKGKKSPKTWTKTRSVDGERERLCEECQ